MNEHNHLKIALEFAEKRIEELETENDSLKKAYELLYKLIDTIAPFSSPVLKCNIIKNEEYSD